MIGSNPMSRLSRTLLLIVILLGAALPRAQAQDYAREKRWAEEVVPNLVVGDAVWLKEASGRKFLGLYTPVEHAKTAVLLVHGIGVNPDFGVIGVLRVALADKGLATLSIQMPVLAADGKVAHYYPALFPEAGERIAAGASWLAAKGYGRIVLLSHSLGSWMSEWTLERTSREPFVAWVCLGRGGAFAEPAKLRLPVLDVYGENDLPLVLANAAKRRAVASKQIMIPKADHFYTGREQTLTDAVAAFVAELK
jgi:pimeloyl-ACP methyl ester carboxylesterase